MRLIDAEKLKELFCSRCSGYGDCANEGFTRFCSAKSAIDISPTIDAKPVVHGHWENVHTISAGLFLRNREVFTESKCSACGRWTVRLARCKNDCFCPLCGADMRGERKEGYRLKKTSDKTSDKEVQDAIN